MPRIIALALARAVLSPSWSSSPSPPSLSRLTLVLAALIATTALAQDPQFVKIEAGGFLMGGKETRSFNIDHGEYRGEDERPRHPVRLTKPFYFSKTEVTVGQFRRFVETTDYITTAESSGKGALGFDPHQLEDRRTNYTFRYNAGFTWKNPGFEQTADHPVVGVSWLDANAYCVWLTKETGVKHRLPTEAEWEHACRGGTETRFSWGDDYRNTIHKMANIGNVELEKALPDRASQQWLFDVDRDPVDPFVHTAPVARFPPNGFGLHDMHGNVWEWCDEVYLDTYYQKYKAPKYDLPIPRAVDPVNEKQMNDFGDWRAIRGGSWFTSPVQSRSAVRSYFEAGDSACYLGFRVVREASPEDVSGARRAFEQEQQAIDAVDQAVGGFRSRDGTELRIEARALDPAVSQYLPRVPNLVNVRLSANGDLDPQVLEHVAAISKLRTFHLHNPGPAVVASHLAPFASRADLESVVFSYCPTLKDEAIGHFAANRDLRVLNVDCRQVTDEGIRRFAALENLTELRLAGSLSRGEVLSEFAGPSLKTVSVRGMTDASAAHLAKLPNLEHLDLQQSEISSTGMNHIAGSTRLRQLDLRDGQNIEDEAFRSLSELRMIEELRVGGTQAGDAAVGYMSKMQALSNLDIGSEQLTDRGMRGICEILTLRSLTITADATNVTDRGFVDFWRLNRLDNLTIACPKVNGEGFGPLTELPNLHNLRVDSAELTDEGLRFISEIPQLQRLWLGDRGRSPSKITDKGLLYLKDSATLRHFEIVREGTSITKEAIDELRSALPGCQINVRD